MFHNYSCITFSPSNLHYFWFFLLLPDVPELYVCPRGSGLGRPVSIRLWQSHVVLQRCQFHRGPHFFLYDDAHLHNVPAVGTVLQQWYISGAQVVLQRYINGSISSIFLHQIYAATIRKETIRKNGHNIGFGENI